MSIKRRRKGRDWVGEYWCKPPRGESILLGKMRYYSRRIGWGIYKWAVVPQEGHVMGSDCMVEGWIV